MTAGDVSPLLNAFEAAAGTSAPCPMVDAFRLEMAANPQPAKLLAALDEICDRSTDSDVVRAGLNEMSWALLDATLQAVPHRVLARAAALSDPHQRGHVRRPPPGAGSHPGQRGPHRRQLSAAAGARNRLPRPPGALNGDCRCRTP